MIHITPAMDRRFDLWKDLDDKKAGEYLKELKLKEEAIRKTRHHLPDAVLQGDKTTDRILELIRYEIKLCEFYFELNQKMRQDGFGEWKLFTAEERPDIHYDHQRAGAGDAWIMSNGRIRAAIEINRKHGVMARVQLTLDNDSEHLNFLYERKAFQPKSLRKQESIDKHVAGLKEQVELEMQERLFPSYSQEQENFRVLKELLHIEEVE